MLRIAILSIVLSTGCTARRFDATTLVASTATIVCDYGQTRSAASMGWKERYEDNPIMGRQPTTAVVDAYFLSAVALNVIMWASLPPKWRSALPVAVVVGQASPIYNNIETTNTVCGM